MSTIEAEQEIWSRRLRRKNCAYSEPLGADSSMTTTASVSKSSGSQPVSAAQKLSTAPFALSDKLLMSSNRHKSLPVAGRFPQLNCLVSARGSERLAIGRKRDCINNIFVTFEHSQ